MKARNGIEFFHSSKVEDLAEKINDFLRKNFKNIIVVKRNIFFYGNEYKVSILYKKGSSNLANPEKVKFFSYDDCYTENESSAEKSIKDFISTKENVLDVLSHTYIPERPSSENRPLIVRSYRIVSEYNLVAIFYQD